MTGNRSVLVTGASRGIGRAIALRIARDGFDVVVHCRSRVDEAQAVAAEIQALGQQARVLAFDVADRAAARAALDADVDAHGAFYGVVCNAGIARDGAFPALSEDDWDQVIHTNLDGFYNVLHPLIMPMVRRRKPGRIVTLSSVSGVAGNRGQVNYSAAKAGIIGATKALALELASRHAQRRSGRPCAEADPRRPCRPPGGSGRHRRLPAVRAGRLHHPPGDLGERGHDLMAADRRVVVTGAAAISPLGHDWPTIEAHLRSCRNAVRTMPEWDVYAGLNTKLAAPAQDYDLPPNYNRKTTRSMGKVAIMSVRATEVALREAGLFEHPVLRSGRAGVAYGSSSGSHEATGEFGRMLHEFTTDGISATTYLKMMSHTAPVNIGVFFGLSGRVYTTSSACTSGSQGVGAGYEAIRSGKQTVMVAGGAEQLDATAAAVFDTLFATSTRNDAPQTTPRPFDAGRDGLVLGEGACTLILEDLEHAQARGATILAEIVGYGTNSDGQHVTQPSADTMAQAMRLALEDAGLQPSQIDYVNAHGTATDHGDIAETQATAQVFGSRMPISSLKSYVGHMLGACGAFEAWMSIEMMRAGWFAPTLNLGEVDPRCGQLDFITGQGRELQAEYVMSNNFAFGGINTSLVFRRWSE